MMNLVLKKKKHKFDVDLTLEELSNVAVANAVLFAKIRLLDGGSFSAKSSSVREVDHKVSWGIKFSFQCKISASPTTSLLDSCKCRISVRKETRGGKSYDKIGFADINLSEFAGGGLMTRSYLLEGYTIRDRQDNSMLRISVRLNLASLDPCFITPGPRSEVPEELPKPEDDEQPETPVTTPEELANLPDFNSLSKKMRGTTPVPIGEGVLTEVEPDEEFKKGHSRHSSNSSHMSKGSGYGSLTSQSQHSRQSSAGESTLIRSTSSGTCSGQSDSGTFERLNKRKKASDDNKDTRLTDTRVDNGQVIEQLIGQCNLKNVEEEESAESSGLQLWVSNDGAPVFSTHELQNKARGAGYQPVLMNNR